MQHDKKADIWSYLTSTNEESLIIKSKTSYKGNLFIRDRDQCHLYGECKNCGSDVFCWPHNFNFPILSDYIWICSGEKDRNCINCWRPEFGWQDIPEWIE